MFSHKDLQGNSERDDEMRVLACSSSFLPSIAPTQVQLQLEYLAADRSCMTDHAAADWLILNLRNVYIVSHSGSSLNLFCKSSILSSHSQNACYHFKAQSLAVPKNFALLRGISWLTNQPLTPGGEP